MAQANIQRTISAVYRAKTLSYNSPLGFRQQTLLYVGRRTEDMEPFQSHSDGSQLTVEFLQAIL